MQPLDSLVVSESLESYARDRLAESDFFAGLSSGQINPGHVRDVFGQYYLWRSRFYRWFGICLVKSVPSRNALNAPRVLGELITCLEREIKGDHHRQALSFLAALGIDNPARIRALPVTDAYAESFLQCYFRADRTRPRRDHHQRASRALRHRVRPRVLQPAPRVQGGALPDPMGSARQWHRGRHSMPYRGGQAGDLGTYHLLGRCIFNDSRRPARADRHSQRGISHCGLA
jgi:hypothetical protein